MYAAEDALHTMTTDRIPKLPADKHFLFLSDSCLFMVHLDLRPLFPEIAKTLET